MWISYIKHCQFLFSFHVSFFHLISLASLHLVLIRHNSLHKLCEFLPSSIIDSYSVFTCQFWFSFPMFFFHLISLASLHLLIIRYNSLKLSKLLSILVMTQNFIWWWSSTSRNLGSVAYSLVAITPRSTLTQSGGIRSGRIWHKVNF